MEGRQSVQVLVVDDSAVARQALTSLLEREGYDVETAGSAAEARALVDARTPRDIDLVLLDLHLPDGTGIDICAELKRRTDWSDVPVILITSSDDERHLSAAFSAGATDYLTKPPREIELRARLGGALRLKEEMDRRKAREAELECLNRRLIEQADELQAARRALLDLNRTLEQRVIAQVEEIVRRAEEVDVLNAQLRVQVQERSRELAEALRHLPDRGAASRPLEPGTILAGRVRLHELLDSGGMGQVYRAEDLLTGERVAVKLLDARLYGGARDLRRFIDEAALAAAVAHPAIVRTRHVDVTEHGRLFQIMELVDGMTLKACLVGGPLPPARCLAVARVVADALAAAHRVGVVHRDIKPANLMICSDAPGVRVLDFGISKTVDGTTRLTRTETGGALGTPAYMSPEQFDVPAAITAATDIYSLGVVMFEMATGRLPFFRARGRASQPASADRSWLEGLDAVPAELADVISWCLSDAPDDRPSAAELAAALNRMHLDESVTVGPIASDQPAAVAEAVR